MDPDDREPLPTSETATGTLFADPDDFYPPTPPPTTVSHTLRGGQTLTLHLVGHSPLEAHHLWNGARVVADFFEADPALVRGRAVCELGAGAGLPSIAAALRGARTVVVTDYPDADLLANLSRNAREAGLEEGEVLVVEGYVWGGDPGPLMARLGGDDGGGAAGAEGFDVLILADLLFRHSEHGHLVDSIQGLLRKGRECAAYVFFTSYRPWLREKDLSFFDVARERGFVVEQIFESMMERPLFEDDPGDEDVRRTVSGFTVKWPKERCQD